MQEFLKGKRTLILSSMHFLVVARWHIALVQESNREQEANAEMINTVVGVITLEDVIEEMLQREIIEEADFFSKSFR